MAESLLFNAQTGVLMLPEVVTVETIPAILGRKKRAKAQLMLPVQVIDCSAVKQIDSAALALVLVWLRNVSSSITIKNCSQDFLTLLHLYDLDDLVVVESAEANQAV